MIKIYALNNTVFLPVLCSLSYNTNSTKLLSSSAHQFLIAGEGLGASEEINKREVGIPGVGGKKCCEIQENATLS